MAAAKHLVVPLERIPADRSAGRVSSASSSHVSILLNSLKSRTRKTTSSRVVWQVGAVDDVADQVLTDPVGSPVGVGESCAVMTGSCVHGGGQRSRRQEEDALSFSSESPV